MLSGDRLEQFAAEGFLPIPSLVDWAAIREARGLLDPLFARYDELSSRVKRDLGASTWRGERIVRIAEINRPTLLESRLKQTQIYRACCAIAAQVAGRTVAYTFDHAIYKAPFNERDTPWHQDHAYTGQVTPPQTVHFWIPLQEATVANGCMQFVPGSHRQGLRQHVRLSNGHVLRTDDVDTSHAVACPLSVGGVTIHSPLTLHYTGPNTTAEVRRAWILHFGPWGRAAKFFPGVLAERLFRMRRERDAARSAFD